MSERKLAVTATAGLGGTVFTAEQLISIASAAGSGNRMEMTPFKQLYVNVDESRGNEAEKIIKEAGLRVLPAGYYTKNLQACNFCKGAEDAGLKLAVELDEVISGLQVPTPIKIGYAGCALGTSEPLTREISVVKMRDVYDIYIGGDVKGIKPVFAQLFMQGVQEVHVILFVLKLIRYYHANAKGKEKFKKFIDRMTMDKLKRAVEI
jgi:precorrin-3B C17-methyltransferase